MVGSEDAIGTIQRLLACGVQVWLTGGWGIDALLGEETRPHKDLDVLILLDDVARAREVLGREGFTLRELWPENRWAPDAHGMTIPTAFVLQDPAGREVDVHAIRLDDRSRGVSEWEGEAFLFTREDLIDEGTIAGVPVRCISLRAQILCHTGYELPEVQARDLERLRERSGVEFGES
jgi:lincosamide nucleotidyltransferase A/C/D/E